MPKFKLHEVERITHEEWGLALMLKPESNKALFLQTEGYRTVFPGSSRGTLSTENTAQHTYTYTRGGSERERKSH
jgi:hypothetical protein